MPAEKLSLYLPDGPTSARQLSVLASALETALAYSALTRALAVADERSSRDLRPMHDRLSELQQSYLDYLIGRHGDVAARSAVYARNHDLWNSRVVDLQTVLVLIGALGTNEQASNVETILKSLAAERPTVPRDIVEAALSEHGLTGAQLSLEDFSGWLADKFESDLVPVVSVEHGSLELVVTAAQVLGTFALQDVITTVDLVNMSAEFLKAYFGDLGRRFESVRRPRPALPDSWRRVASEFDEVDIEITDERVRVKLRRRSRRAAGR